MVLIIDNYDSFTYNLAQQIGELGHEFKVIRNDEITPDDADAIKPTHLVISPGPGRPEQAGNSIDLIRHFTGRIPILGVCLGHQCLAHAYQGTITNAETLVHGKTSMIYHFGEGLFQGMPNPFEATRYHSLIVDDATLPQDITVTAHTSAGEIMGIQLTDRSAVGVQFHPESVLTKHGKLLLTNFLNMG